MDQKKIVKIAGIGVVATAALVGLGFAAKGIAHIPKYFIKETYYTFYKILTATAPQHSSLSLCRRTVSVRKVI